MIILSQVNKSYGSLKVLSDINLTINNKEITAISGASGAGKTTLLQIAGSLMLPDSGKVSFDGEDLTSMKDKALSAFRNRNIGFIFQFHQLIEELTALENAMFPALIAGDSRKVAADKAAELLERLGLAGRATHHPSQMSGGERQRVAIARAMINRPRIIFADEPTGSLDTHNRDEIINLITELNRTTGQGFVIVTHDPNIAARAHQVVMMSDGRILAEVSNRENMAN